jgi:hypothetical protein
MPAPVDTSDDDAGLRVLADCAIAMRWDLREILASQQRMIIDQVHISEGLTRIESKLARLDRRLENLDAGLEASFENCAMGFDRFESAFEVVDARFQQLIETISADTRVLLDAIRSNQSHG